MADIVALPAGVDAQTVAAWTELNAWVARQQAAANAAAVKVRASRQVGIAVGLLMAHYRMTDTDAYLLLTQLAAGSDLDISAMADKIIIDHGGTPTAPGYVSEDRSAPTWTTTPGRTAAAESS